MEMSSRAIVFSGLALLVCSSVSWGVQGSDFNLGKLHWCQTKCLCHDDTEVVLACFTDDEIYTLMNLKPKKIQRLKQFQFNLIDKLTWCNETCLCHKNGRKEFKCSDREKFGDFIKHLKPEIAHYLEPEEEEEPPPREEEEEVKEEVEVEEEEKTVEESKKERHEKKKGKKHNNRKNKKKNHSRKEEMATTQFPPVETTELTPSPPPLSNRDDLPPSEDTRTIFRANFGPFEGKFPPPSSGGAGGGEPSEGKMSEDWYEWREEMTRVKSEVALNQHILLVTVAFSSLALIGVSMLAIYTCCSRKSKSSKHNISKSSRSDDDSNMTKVNLTDQAW